LDGCCAALPFWGGGDRAARARSRDRVGGWGAGPFVCGEGAIGRREPGCCALRGRLRARPAAVVCQRSPLPPGAWCAIACRGGGFCSRLAARLWPCGVRGAHPHPRRVVAPPACAMPAAALPSICCRHPHSPPLSCSWQILVATTRHQTEHANPASVSDVCTPFRTTHSASTFISQPGSLSLDITPMTSKISMADVNSTASSPGTEWCGFVTRPTSTWWAPRRVSLHENEPGYIDAETTSSRHSSVRRIPPPE